jgi:hypothetical protein
MVAPHGLHLFPLNGVSDAAAHRGGSQFATVQVRTTPLMCRASGLSYAGLSAGVRRFVAVQPCSSRLWRDALRQVHRAADEFDHRARNRVQLREHSMCWYDFKCKQLESRCSSQAVRAAPTRPRRGSARRTDAVHARRSAADSRLRGPLNRGHNSPRPRRNSTSRPTKLSRKGDGAGPSPLQDHPRSGCGVSGPCISFAPVLRQAVVIQRVGRASRVRQGWEP